MTQLKKYNVRRAVKFNITNLEEKIVEDFVDFHFKCVIAINTWLWSNHLSKNIDIKKSSSLKIFVNDLDKQITNCKMISENIFGLKDLFIKLGLDSYQISYSRGIVQYILSRYKGFLSRNKNQIKSGTLRLNKTHIKRKEVALLNQIIKLDKNKCELTLNTQLKNNQGSLIVLKYDDKNSYLRYIENLGSSTCQRFGGNICIKQHVLVAACSLERTFSYSPKGHLGLDVNQNEDNWIATSQPINGCSLFKKPNDIAKVEDKIGSINKELNERFRKGKKIIKPADRPFKSAHARKLRKKVKNLHKKHRNLVAIFFSSIGLVDYAINNKLLIGIDEVKTGQTNGTFGQEKVREYLIKQCEDRCVPFVTPPTPYSSRTCSRCNFVSKERHSKCSNCGCDTHADINAAINTGKWALAIFKVLGHCSPRHEQQSLIKKTFTVNEGLPSLPNKKNTPPEIGRSHLKTFNSKNNNHQQLLSI